jgi:hypothetical protein
MTLLMVGIPVYVYSNTYAEGVYLCEPQLTFVLVLFCYMFNIML